jgi:hypothetical protein
MRRCRLVALAVAAAAGLAGGPVCAQRPAGERVRVPTFARVETDGGEPLANAVVTFVGCVPHVGVLGPRDEQAVQTDARGRAHAKLDPALCYVAWAVGPALASGERAASRAIGWFAAGHVFTLRCEPPSVARHVRVEGAEAWARLGPLRYTARTGSPGTAVELAPDDGELVLPHGPFVQIEVGTADGAPLCLLPLAGAAARLVVPQPQRVPVRVLDGRDTPVAGARIELRVGKLQAWRLDGPTLAAEERRRAVGTTGPDGRCTVEVPYAADPLREPQRAELVLFASAPGRPAVFAGVLNNAVHTLGEAVKAPVEELVFACRTADALRGTVGRVPAGTAVHLAAVCRLHVGGGGYQHDPRSFVAAVGADGSFVFDQVPADVLSLRCTVLAGDGGTGGWPLFPAVAARELPAELAAPGGGVWLPEAYADVTLRVIEPNGGPARGRVALLAAAPAAPAARVLTRDATVRCPLDPSGATVLRLVPGSWVVAVCTEGGWSARDLAVVAGAHEVVLTMQPHARARYELRGADGQPIAGARVVLRRSSTRGTTDPMQAMLQALRGQWTESWADLRTDRDGRVAVPFVPVEGVTLAIALEWDGGATADLPLDASDDWTAVRPR